MKRLISLSCLVALFTTLHACDRGGSKSVTGVEGSPVAIRLQAVTIPENDYEGEGPPFAINPQGCTNYCGQTNSDAPEYVEIMASVDGGDAETIYNGDYSTSLTVRVPNGDVLLLVLIYNCDCCTVFSGYAELSLPGDGGEVTILMNQEELAYEWTYARDEDGDTYCDIETVENLCREATEEEGWVPECFYTEGDCDDHDPDINLDATEICNDDVDNDCDGDVDCDDEDCFVFGPCQN